MPRKKSSTAMCGWCSANDHANCIGQWRKWWYETKKRKQVIVYDDVWTECGCPKKHKKPEPSRPVEDLEAL